MTIKQYVFRDTILMIILGVVWACFNFNFFLEDSPVRPRGWFMSDISISLPYTGHGTIPTIPLVLFAFAMPIVALILTWIFIDKLCCPNWNYNDIEKSNDIELFSGIPYIKQSNSHREQTSTSTDGIDSQSLASLVDVVNPTDCQLTQLPPSPELTKQQYALNLRRIELITSDPKNWAHYHDEKTSILSRKIRFAIWQLFIFLTIAIFTVLVTTSLKWIVSRHRPDFLARCQPDYSHPDLIIGTNGWIDSNFTFICQNQDKSFINAGLESFPSGHSSSSLTASTFVSILFYKRCLNRGQRLMGFIIIPFLIMVVMAGGLLIATSRSWDNRHHFGDITFGSILGIASGLLSLVFTNAFEPTWECDQTLFKHGQNEAASLNNEPPSSPTTINQVELVSQ